MVAEAFELVEDGILTEDQFAQFVFRNPAQLFLDQNPRFVDDIADAGRAAELVGR